MKWIKANQEPPTKDGKYIVKYKGGSVGNLYWWETFWANGNVDVSFDVDYWLDESSPIVQEQEELWEKIGELLMEEASVEYNMELLKQHFTITKKQ